MKKIITFFIVFVFSSALFAATNEEKIEKYTAIFDLCDNIESIAGTLMGVRQQGYSRAEINQYIEEHVVPNVDYKVLALTKKIVTEAYKYPVKKSKQSKNKMIADFQTQWKANCFASF